MAEPATPRPLHEETAGENAPPPYDPPPYEPGAIDRAYLQERARRRARIERSRARRHASVRFWIVLLVLLAASIVLIVTIWREIERLFGL